jgi:hypothetical protein
MVTKWFANNSAEIASKASRDTEEIQELLQKLIDCAKTGRETY